MLAPKFMMVTPRVVPSQHVRVLSKCGRIGDEVVTAAQSAGG
jgi:hypothetical protein